MTQKTEREICRRSTAETHEKQQHQQQHRTYVRMNERTNQQTYDKFNGMKRNGTDALDNMQKS